MWYVSTTKKGLWKKKKPQKSYYLKTKQTNPKVNEDFLQFWKKKRNKKSKEHVGHVLASSSNHSKFRYRVYSIKRMCDYFFFWWGKKDYCCCCWCFGLELLYGNCKTWCSSRFQKLCTPPPPSPPEFIIHAVYPATINQKTGTEKYDIILSCPRPPPPPLLVFSFLIYLLMLFINKLFHVPHSLLESLPKSQTLKLRRKKFAFVKYHYFCFLFW